MSYPLGQEKAEEVLAMWVLSVLGREPEVFLVQRTCPVCGHPYAQKHGRRRRCIQDLREAEVSVQRMRCPRCQATWTLYPRGLEPYRRRSQRVRELGVLLYALGLGYRKTVQVLASLGVLLSPVTVLADVVAAGVKAREMNRQLRGRARVRRVGPDASGCVTMCPQPTSLNAPSVLGVKKVDTAFLEMEEERLAGTGLEVRRDSTRHHGVLDVDKEVQLGTHWLLEGQNGWQVRLILLSSSDDSNVLRAHTELHNPSRLHSRGPGWA